MLQRKWNRLVPTGLLMLAGGLLLHNFEHSRHLEFLAGFLIGMSIVFVILGFLKQSHVSR